MPDSPEIPESDLWDLDAFHNTALDAQATNDLVYRATEKALGEVARRFYPGIANWEPEQLRRLADRISRAAQDYCIELENLDFASEKAREGE
jgi:hypothetical protein